MRHWLFICAAIVTTTAGAVSFAQSETTENDASIDVTQTTCRDMLLASGDEEENILIFFHGYMTGKKNETVINVDAFRDVSETILSDCIDNPDATLIAVFESKR